MLSREFLKNLRKLHQKKFREQEGRFLAEGVNLVSEALASDFEAEFLFVTETFEKNPAFPRLQNLAEKKRVPVERISAKDFQALSQTRSPQGVVVLLKKPDFVFSEERAREWRRVVALDGLQDPGNVGTIIRTADWYGCDAVLLGAGCVDVTNSKVLRATAGSLFHLPVFEGISLREVLKKLREAGFGLFAAESTEGTPHHRVQFPEQAVLILGNERQGVGAEAKSAGLVSVRIPQRGRAESLNAAVAAAVILDRMIFPGNQP